MAKKSGRSGGKGFNHGAVAKRLREMSGDFTLRELARETGANHETIRRYLDDGRPSIEFVHAFCTRFKVSADWLLGLKKR